MWVFWGIGIGLLFLAAAGVFLGAISAPDREQRERDDREFLEFAEEFAKSRKDRKKCRDR